MNIIGNWSTEGYDFEASKAIINERFVGLETENHIQNKLTEPRLDAWLEEITPHLLAGIKTSTE